MRPRSRFQVVVSTSRFYYHKSFFMHKFNEEKSCFLAKFFVLSSAFFHLACFSDICYLVRIERWQAILFCNFWPSFGCSGSEMCMDLNVGIKLKNLNNKHLLQ
jgi:uncharacterized membrane protein YcfT